MLIVVAAVLGVLAVRLTGRPLSRLAKLRFTAVWLVPLALAVQVVTISFTPPGPEVVYRVIHLATYVALGAFVWLNRRIPWLWLVALGGACNMAAISANGGVMPASPDALRRAGLSESDGFTNSDVVDDPRLAALGDVFATPEWLPLANVFSVGDVLLVVGLALLVLRACQEDCGDTPGPSAGGDGDGDGRGRTSRGADGVKAIENEAPATVRPWTPQLPAGPGGRSNRSTPSATSPRRPRRR